MEEYEEHTESIREKIHEVAEESKSKWSFYVALSTALMAVFAAISGLLAGDHANEALIEQVKASDQWAYYQAKSIKAEIAASTGKIMGTDTVNAAKTAKYEKDKEAIKETAQKHEETSEWHLGKHKILARAVTFFQVAIAIAAISLLSKKRPLWYVSMALAVVGLGFLLQGTVF